VDISVAICTYNGGRFLSEQLKSIGKQSRPPCEVIICDDVSTDSTVEIVKGFAGDAPFPVRFERNEVNLGSTRNFEKAIGLCRGDAIALCDQDDIWERDKLQRMGQVLECEPDVGGVFSDAVLVDEDSQPMAESLWERAQFTSTMQATLNGNSAALMLLEKNTVTGATFLFRSRFVKLVVPIPSEWVHDAWIALLIATQSRLRALPDRLMSYRLHPTQQVGVNPARWNDALRVERAKAKADHDLLEKRWYSMTAKLSTLLVDPRLMQRAKDKYEFLQARTALRQQNLGRRLISATMLLPGHFKFRKGLLSYCRDVTGAGYRK
jgi:glycosyltransferase involved in cell wall biosynthesis